MEYKYTKTEYDFIGRIPSHWKTTKLKNNCLILPSNVDKKTKENELDVELCNYVDVYYNNFITNSIDFMSATATEKQYTKFHVEIDDVIITKDSEDPNDIGIPALVKETKENLLCGYHLTTIRSKMKNVLGHYIFWCLKDPLLATQLNKEATGVTRWAISSRHIKNFVIPLPPLEEQISICKYLDDVSERIYHIIKLKFGSSKIQNDDDMRSQIKILMEYQDSLIHECVTGKKRVTQSMETIKKLN